MATEPASRLVILLHGVGASGDDLAPLGDIFGKALPGTLFEAPDAPEPSTYGGGYQWFSVAGVTPENRPDRVRAARAGFDRTVEAIIEKHGFSGRLDHVAFVGFSQGTIMSLDAVATGRWPVACLVGFSGRLASPLPLSPSLRTPVLLVHGTGDPVIPASETEQAASALQSLGMAVEMLIIPGLGHAISDQGIARASTFLAQALET